MRGPGDVAQLVEHWNINPEVCTSQLSHSPLPPGRGTRTKPTSICGGSSPPILTLVNANTIEAYKQDSSFGRATPDYGVGCRFNSDSCNKSSFDTLASTILSTISSVALPPSGDRPLFRERAGAIRGPTPLAWSLSGDMCALFVNPSKLLSAWDSAKIRGFGGGDLDYLPERPSGPQGSNKVTAARGCNFMGAFLWGTQQVQLRHSSLILERNTTEAYKRSRVQLPRPPPC